MLPCAAMCIWTQGQKNRLFKRAKHYDAALIMGCESARVTAEQILEGTNCRVILGMRLVGITNATLKFRFPATLDLAGPAQVSANEHREDEHTEEAASPARFTLVHSSAPPPTDL